MTLDEYLKQSGLSQAAFGARVGLPQATISRYVSGTRFPDKETVRRIEAATDGAVMPADWYGEPVLRPDIFKAPETTP
jgi:transcriptional regulator with XRE-family HTH domain